MTRGLLLAAALAAGCATTPKNDPPPSDPPVRARGIIEAIEEGAAFLLKAQNPDGSWGSARDTSDFDILAAVPGAHEGFRCAVTALAVMALREIKAPAEPVARGVAWLLQTPPPRRANPVEIYNVWAHAYAVQALAGAYADEKDEIRRAGIRAGVERHLKSLQAYETMYGGWNYYDFDAGTQRPASAPTSFGTGAVLVAFFDARKAGLEIPEAMIRRAVKGVAGCRNPDGSYLYDLGFKFHPRHLANRDKGSLGRTQAANIALYVWGEKLPKTTLRDELDRMFREHKFLDIGRKRQYPHEAWYFNSGYYYYFGHYYASRVIEVLEAGDRHERRSKLASHVLPYQEGDGSWWDYKMWSYHKVYGTSFAVMTLLRCLDAPYVPRRGR